MLVNERPRLVAAHDSVTNAGGGRTRLTDEEVRADSNAEERDPEKIRTFTRLAAGDLIELGICCAAKGTNSAKTISNFSVRSCG